MEFREDIGQYVFEYEGLIFAWDEEPEEDIQDTVKTLANNYFKHLDGIIDFMLPDIKEIYGQVTVEDVKRNLGRPIVDYDNGKVTYCEQSFDDCHAVSIGLSLDSTATECWDNPISANPNRSGIKADIESRLNRYKNSEGFTAVWIWAEKLSDTEYNIYIGYC